METELTNNIASKEVSDSSEDTCSEMDLPPEYCRYRDEGCEFASSCLDCPFAKCVYEECGGRQHYTKRLRNGEMVRLFSEGSKGVRELALMFDVSQRTVQRVLKGVKE